MIKTPIIIVISLLLSIFSCSNNSMYNFGDPEAIKTPVEDNFYFKSIDIEYRGHVYQTDQGYLVVNENDSMNESKLIKLPMVKIFSTSKNPQEPVFLLMGGPGITNIWDYPPVWLLENHDIVMVGYRGIDGPINFDSPEVSKALTQKDLISEEGLKVLGNAYFAAYSRFMEMGINMDSYSMEEVIADIESARNVLGYDRINLYSNSYGTRLAYLYGLAYPDSVKRSFMSSANPPGGFIYHDEVFDEMLKEYDVWWNENEELKSRTSDLSGTIKSVLTELPEKWLIFPIDEFKIRFLTQALLMDTNSATMIFDAYVCAAEGDPSGLALLTFMYDFMMPNNSNWGDNISKVVSADFDLEAEYSRSSDSIIGSPWSEMLESLKYGGWPSSPISDELRIPQYSSVETLIINGELDFSTPLANIEMNLIPYLTNGTLIAFPYKAHAGELSRDTAYKPYVMNFFKNGDTDASSFKQTKNDLSIDQSPSEMAKKYLTYALLAILIIMAIISIAFIVIRKIISKRNLEINN